MCLPSGLKSASINSLLGSDLLCSSGAASGLVAFQSLRIPSVPPVIINLPSGEYLAKFWNLSFSLPFSSVSNSHNSVKVFAAASNDKTLQQDFALASHKPV